MILAQVTRIVGSKRAALFLVLILLLTSAAFSVTLAILSSVQATASGMLGESGDTIVVAQQNSRAPFLGTLPLGLENSVVSVQGVEAVSPEVFAPATLSGVPVMVRGVEPAEFMRLQDPTMLQGSPLSANDTASAMVGATLAGEMGLHPGSEITLVGGVRATVAQVEVKGVFSTTGAPDDEVVAPLAVGEWLRGIDYGIVSIFRVEVSPQDNPSQVAARVQNAVQAASGTAQTESPGESYLPVTSTVSSFAGHVVEASPDVSSSFFSKTVGLSQENVLLISALVFVSMSVAIVCALQEAVFRSRNELGTLRTLGMSSRRLSLDLVLVATLLGLAASVGGLGLGWAFLSVIQYLQPVRIAFYAIDPLSAFPLAAAYSVLVVTGAGFVAAVLSSLRFRQPLAVYRMTLPYSESDLGHV